MGNFAAVVMAAGLGTRMKSATPKHLHPLLGRRLLDWVVEAVRPLGPDPLVVVVAPDAVDAVEGMDVAVQEKPLGTGDSLRAARERVGNAQQLLVVSGDHPRLSSGLL
jgi:bifunctional UDP-N-acetylglucosamine pyrophosphorylase/glucosamine-1-phosphate N-acetyltransferase